MSRVVGEAQRPGGSLLSGDLKPSVSQENQIWEAQVVTHFLAGIESMISRKKTFLSITLADSNWQ